MLGIRMKTNSNIGLSLIIILLALVPAGRQEE
jgi:hypothetical protein